jgi:hypothetical protein
VEKSPLRCVSRDFGTPSVLLIMPLQAATVEILEAFVSHIGTTWQTMCNSLRLSVEFLLSWAKKRCGEVDLSGVVAWRRNRYVRGSGRSWNCSFKAAITTKFRNS